MAKERSEAAHRRKVLAEARRKIPADLLERRIQGKQDAEKRLEEVKDMLSRDNDFTDKERTGLMVENIWLEFKLGRLTSTERQSQLQRLLNTLQEGNHEVYEWLTGVGQNGLIPLAKIRDNVITPTVIGGYHTKRG